MDGLTEFIKVIPALSDVTSWVLGFLVIVWLVNKFLDKQQEQTMMHNEQMDKAIKIIANYTENLTEIIALIREGNEKTATISKKLDEVNYKVDSLRDNKNDKDPDG